jgi:hypothetical protein
MHRSMRIISRLLGTGALMCVVPLPCAHAQTPRELRDPAVARECEARARAYIQSPAAADVVLLAECAKTGPARLATAWRDLSAAPDSGTLLQLMRTSALLPDARLARVLLALSMDEAAPVLVRSAAVATLAAYLEPSFTPTVYRKRSDPAVLEIGLPQRTHSSSKPVVEPLDEVLRGGIRGAFRELSESSASFALRTLAQHALSVAPSAARTR